MTLDEFRAWLAEQLRDSQEVYDRRRLKMDDSVRIALERERVMLLQEVAAMLDEVDR